MDQLRWIARPSQAIDVCYPLRVAPFLDVTSGRSAANYDSARQVQFEQLAVPEGEAARHRHSVPGNTISEPRAFGRGPRHVKPQSLLLTRRGIADLLPQPRRL